MKNLFKLSYLAVALSVLSCTNDLNTVPKDDDLFLSDDFFATEASYKQGLAGV